MLKKTKFNKYKFRSFLILSLFIFGFIFIINLYEYIRYSEPLIVNILGFKLFISILTAFITVYIFNFSFISEMD